MKEEVLENRSGETGTQSVAASRVVLDSFRNYASLDVDLSPGFNILSGPNAQGKTNFLEALYLVATTRLLRGQRENEAIREGSERASVMIELADSGTKLSMALQRGGRKRAAINGLNTTRAADLIGRMPCVSVTSADLLIVRGEPSDRRLFLDLELSALYPAYLRHLSHYKRALEQRNALLRESRDWPQPSVVFEPWEEQLATHGVALREIRSQYLEELSPSVSEVHKWIGGGEAVEVAYAAKDESWTSDDLRFGLETGRSQDVARGGTSVGPHRDDLTILVGGREARLFGSQGQQRTSVIAIKMACLEQSRQVLGWPPLLLLDDILSDLDEHRRAALVEVVLQKAGQAVLTCTEESAAGEKVLHQAKRFGVREGALWPK